MSAPSPQQEMRHRNLARVLHTVAAHGPCSRAAVAARIGLTRAAVSTLVDELLSGGLLVEAGVAGTGGVGRPGRALRLAASGPCGLGAEIGVDHLAVCAVDLRGTVRARRRVEGRHRDSDPAAALDRLARLVAEVTAEASAAGLVPAGLAVAVPGLVARGSTTVVRAPNLGWREVDLAALLGRSVPLTADNEANFGAMAQLWLDDAAPRDFVHVSAQIGIGGAVVVEGELLRGARGFAGELGHVPVSARGPACACGGRGCLEQYAGEEAVLRAAGLTPPPGAEATVLLAKRAAAGDRAAQRALREAGRALGVALTGAVNLLDPTGIVLGGALARLGPWLLPPVARELASRTTAPEAVPELRVSALGDQGPLLGAAHSVVRTVLDDPPTTAAPAPASP